MQIFPFQPVLGRASEADADADPERFDPIEPVSLVRHLANDGVGIVRPVLREHVGRKYHELVSTEA